MNSLKKRICPAMRTLKRHYESTTDEVHKAEELRLLRIHTTLYHKEGHCTVFGVPVDAMSVEEFITMVLGEEDER